MGRRRRLRGNARGAAAGVGGPRAGPGSAPGRGLAQPAARAAEAERPYRPLAERWGDRLYLSAIGAAGEEVVRLYESGERVELLVGGELRKATVGCTGTARPEFVYLLSLPMLDVEDAA